MRLDSPGPTGPDERTISLIAIANMMLRNRRLLVGLPLIVATIVCILALAWPRKYTAQASFMPQSETEDASQFSGLAAQFGIDLGASAPGQSPQFYADLMKSREILGAVVETEYSVPAGSGQPLRVETLIQRYGHGAREVERGRFEAVKKLRKRIGVRVNTETGVLRVSIWARNAELARQIADRFLAEVNRFNQETRRSQAAEERRFAGERVLDGRVRLDSAELSLQQFLQHNRQFDASPLLTFEHDRLEREVSMRQQLY